MTIIDQEGMLKHLREHATNVHGNEGRGGEEKERGRATEELLSQI